MGDNNPDELYTLRSQFHLGHFSSALEEAKTLSRSLSKSSPYRAERDEYMLRCYCSLERYDKCVSDGSSSESLGTQAVKLYAAYSSSLKDSSSSGAAGSSSSSNTESTLLQLQEWLNAPAQPSSSSKAAASSYRTLQLMASLIYLQEGMLKEALRSLDIVAGSSTNGIDFEHHSLAVHIFLRMDRADLALKQARIMQAADEEATLTQLATAWCCIAQGGSKSEEALYILAALSEQYGPSVQLLNMSAVAKMNKGSYEEAERDLVEAVAQDSENVELNGGGGEGSMSSADTLINSMCCYQNLGRVKEVDRCMSRLKEGYPQHSYVKNLSAVEAAFDRVASVYASS
jgi:coatomer protein complex subunit epsilon